MHVMIYKTQPNTRIEIKIINKDLSVIDQVHVLSCLRLWPTDQLQGEKNATHTSPAHGFAGNYL